MSSAVTAVPSVAPAKSPKKKRARSAGKKPGLTVSDLIIKAISNERGSVSLVALKKALKAGGYDVVKNKTRILTAVKRLVLNKSLVQTKGTGASGSFKLNKKPPTPKKKKVVKKKKPKAKRVKRTSVKKAAGGASPAAKKSPKKKRKSKAKSPKKAKRPAAAKKTKKAKSPKKAKRRVSKSTTRTSTRAAVKK